MIIDWGLNTYFDGFEPFIFETHSYGIIIYIYGETFNAISEEWFKIANGVEYRQITKVTNLHFRTKPEEN